MDGALFIVYKLFTLPEVSGIRGQFTAAAKVVKLSGNEIGGATTLGVKMSGKRFRIGIDGNQNALAVYRTFKNVLFISQQNCTVGAALQGRGGVAGGGQFGDPGRQLIVLGRI